ncbi:unannotated protein [freshwater metagenome]|uniref:Unannotated protein n=1 Tax=freshwater metagenome TaxID=449393 RepID=A0A6J7F453_9ZZZZ
MFTDPRNPALCIKRFKKPLLGDDAHRLLRLIETAAAARTSERARLMQSVSWPLEAFGERDAVVGYAMPTAPAESYFSLTVAKREKMTLLQTKFLLDSSYWQGAAVGSAQPQVSTNARLEIAIELHDTLCLLHQWGLVYGDISSNNICVRMGRDPGVFLLDADSIVTFEERLKSAVNSPDWQAPRGLDAIQQDRAKFALFIWRLLAQKPSDVPSAAGATEFDTRCGLNIGVVLARVYESGDESGFATLATTLRTRLDPARRHTLFARAVNTGFARQMLTCAEIASGPDELRWVQSAREQIGLEASIDAARGLRRRLLLRQSGAQRYFTLDLLAGSGLVHAPTTAAELERLIYDAEFADIATHLSTTGLGALEAHPWITRSVARALAMEPEIQLRVHPGLETSSIEWTWPASASVNAAVLVVRANGREVETVVTRLGSDRSARRDVSLAPGSAALAQLYAAVQTPNGRVLRGALASDVHFTTPEPPAPPRRAIAPTAPRTATIAVFDPVAEAARIEALRRAARRVVVRRLIASAAAVVVLAVGGVLVKRHFTPGPPTPPNPVVVSLQDDRRVSWTIPAGMTISDITSVLVEQSRDGGATWTPVQSKLTAPRRATRSGTMNIPYPPVLGLVQYRVMAESPTGARRIGPPTAAFDLPALPAPVAKIVTRRTSPTEATVSWSPPFTNDAVAIETYVVLTTFVHADGRPPTTLRRDVTSPSIALTIVDPTDTVTIRILAIDSMQRRSPFSNPTQIPASPQTP